MLSVKAADCCFVVLQWTEGGGAAQWKACKSLCAEKRMSMQKETVSNNFSICPSLIDQMKQFCVSFSLPSLEDFGLLGIHCWESPCPKVFPRNGFPSFGSVSLESFHTVLTKHNFDFLLN